MKPLRILLTGGGTGGHIYPLIAVANEIRKQRPNADFRYAGSPGDFQKVLKENGVRVMRIASSKWRRYFSVLNFLDIFKLFFGVFQALWKIYWYMPDVLFSKGGPGALAVVSVCRFYFIPIFIHESDTIPGFTNKVSARFAKKIFLAFDETRRYIRHQNIETVGQPIRKLPSISQEAARQAIGFFSELPVITILGGSQGSAKLNDFVIANLHLFLQKFQLLHQVGLANYNDYKNEYNVVSQTLNPELKNRYHYAAYFNDEQPLTLTNVIASADIIVSRAGAGAIFELANAGKPAILVPLSNAAADHQQSNAYAYQKSGAAIIIEEENLLPNLFESTVENLLKNPEKLKTMAEAARQFFKPEAATKIAASIIEHL